MIAARLVAYLAITVGGLMALVFIVTAVLSIVTTASAGAA